MNQNRHIKPAEFTRRRKRLMQMMGKASVAILPAAPTRIRNRDAEYAGTDPQTPTWRSDFVLS